MLHYCARVKDNGSMDNLSSPTKYVGPQPWWQAPFPAVLCEKSKLGTFQNSKQAFNALERP